MGKGRRGEERRNQKEKRVEEGNIVRETVMGREKKEKGKKVGKNTKKVGREK